MVNCKYCGKEIEAYFRGRDSIWKHKKGRVRYCNTQPMYQTKAEPAGKEE